MQGLNFSISSSIANTNYLVIGLISIQTGNLLCSTGANRVLIPIIQLRFVGYD